MQNSSRLDPIFRCTILGNYESENEPTSLFIHLGMGLVYIESQCTDLQKLTHTHSSFCAPWKLKVGWGGQVIEGQRIEVAHFDTPLNKQRCIKRIANEPFNPNVENFIKRILIAVFFNFDQMYPNTPFFQIVSNVSKIHQNAYNFQNSIRDKTDKLSAQNGPKPNSLQFFHPIFNKFISNK